MNKLPNTEATAFISGDNALMERGREFSANKENRKFSKIGINVNMCRRKS